MIAKTIRKDFEIVGGPLDGTKAAVSVPNRYGSAPPPVIQLVDPFTSDPVPDAASVDYSDVPQTVYTASLYKRFTRMREVKYGKIECLDREFFYVHSSLVEHYNKLVEISAP